MPRQKWVADGVAVTTRSAQPPSPLRPLSTLELDGPSFEQSLASVGGSSSMAAEMAFVTGEIRKLHQLEAEAQQRKRLGRQSGERSEQVYVSAAVLKRELVASRKAQYQALLMLQKSKTRTLEAEAELESLREQLRERRENEARLFGEVVEAQRTLARRQGPASPTRAAAAEPSTEAALAGADAALAGAEAALVGASAAAAEAPADDGPALAASIALEKERATSDALRLALRDERGKSVRQVLDAEQRVADAANSANSRVGALEEKMEANRVSAERRVAEANYSARTEAEQAVEFAQLGALEAMSTIQEDCRTALEAMRRRVELAERNAYTKLTATLENPRPGDSKAIAAEDRQLWSVGVYEESVERFERASELSRSMSR